MRDVVFEYVMRNFFLIKNISNSIPEISFGSTNIEKRGISVFRGQEDFFEGETDINPDSVVWKEWKGVRIPFLFSKDADEIISVCDGSVVINYDIVSSAFYFLSGWNELYSGVKDKFGRHRFKGSIIDQLGIVELPVVNYYFDIFESAIELAGCELGKKEQSFSVVLTHDIDTCQSAWKEGGLKAIRAWNPIIAIKLLIKRLLGKDEWFNFHTVSAIDKSFGANSTFFFLAENKKAGDIKNADYSIKDVRIQRVIDLLVKAGHEVGVHGSIGSGIDKEKLKNEISKIGLNSICSNRFHYLMFDILSSVSVLENCAIKYDSSLGFADRIGFRRGVCTPFIMFDLANKRISKLIQIPLIVMDGSLQNAHYMSVLQNEVLQFVEPLIYEIEKFNGVFTLLWHNTFFSPVKYDGWRRVFESILERVKQSNAQFYSIEQLIAEKYCSI